MSRFQPSDADRRIAIVGLAARLPGAADAEAFWQLLDAGESGLRRVDAEELRAAGVSEALAGDARYVPFWGGPPEADGFDAGFFGYSPRDAELLDPQQRMFLECAWNALEDAGYDSARTSARIGVYAGASLSSHLLKAAHRADGFQVGLANIGGMVAARTSFHLDLKGPSIGVQTTCSSSLVALHQAMAGLRQGDCDMAIAGAVAVNLARAEGYLHEEESIASPDGTCRPFDAGAAGTVFANGAGVVVLKRLADAVADGDTIHGVLLGSAVNNDGADKVSLNAPSVAGQAAVLSAALASAGIAAADVDLVEAHGTGTALGDPIELAALNRAYGPGLAGRRVAIGAVKGNVGHMDAAAGMAGLIGLLMALRHGRMPRIAHFSTPNPKCSFGAFDPLAEPRDWPRDPARPRRAGLSSFGIGGTNAHLIVEEPPLPVTVDADTGSQLLVLSAKTPSALSALRVNLAGALERSDTPSLADAAFTLQLGRRALGHRQVFVAGNRDGAIAALRADGPVLQPMQGRPDSVFVFSGQGSQRAGMARDLHRTDPVFRAALEECLALIPADLDLRALLLDADVTEPARIDQTRVTQPALFAFEYALARMWMARGVQPVAMLGHSIGEYVAACLAGVFDLPDAIRAVVARGAAMQACPEGAMLAVMISEAEAAGSLPEGVEIAAVNGPRSVVLAGPVAAIEALADRFDRSGIGARLLRTSHAFHSAMMEQALPQFRQVLEALTLREPQLAMLSNVTGGWLGAEAATPDYWLKQLRQPVRYGDAVGQLMELGNPLLIEVGPGAGLIRLARQAMRDKGRGVASLPESGAMDGAAEVLRATGELWAAGVTLDWAALHQGPRRRVSLPGYPFERQSFWLPPVAPGEAAEEESWFHQPVWQRLPLAAPQPAKRLLVLGAELVERLSGGLPASAIKVQRSNDFQFNTNHYGINPESLEHYSALFSALRQNGIEVTDILCAWGLEGDATRAITALAQALAEAGLSPRLTLLGAGMREVTGREVLDPQAAAMLGLVPVLPQEVPGLRCRSIELDRAELDGQVAGLMAAIDAPWDGGALALRGGWLWRGDHVAVPVGGAAPAISGPSLVIGDLAEGLGAAYARGVRQLGQPLILAGRGLPDPGEWDGWLAAHPATDPTVQLIRELRALGGIGDEIVVLAGDETDADWLDTALGSAEARLGPISGVFHTAAMGDAFYNPLQEPPSAEIEARLQTRRDGLIALRQVLATRNAGFCLVQSSLSTLAGGRGLAAYAAANAWVEAFTAMARRDNASVWQAVQWDAAETGSLAENLTGARLLTGDEIWQASLAVIAHPQLAEVAVTPGSLKRRLQMTATPAATTTPDTVPTRRLSAPLIAPRDSYEAAVAQAMAEMLGLPEVGVEDNFFELGGHSLLAIQIINRLKREFSVELPVRALLYEAPTAAGIAATIRKAREDAEREADTLGALLDEIEAEREATPG
ncbi:acyltransferase domain-containing protein [Paracoccus caeni]|uniref:Acyltransferase domain-containing protein n=1 Tax=Paracoccus caeni TaxID=657651 RepID=A0A934VYG6_9RHOB|nr:type I polyketide synthase [Paracoccus caeni]MBK4215972.1 acyltransferase domain-containing protein [Paracoccus caeni]